MLKTIFQKIKSAHWLLMILCCIIPILGLSVLLSANALSSWGYYLLFLVCPLFHLFMIKKMKTCPQEHTRFEAQKLIEYKPADMTRRIK